MICVIQKNLFIVQIFDRNKSIQQFRIDLRNCDKLSENIDIHIARLLNPFI